MMGPPPRPKIYHITHVDNLARIAGDGWLFSDAEMIRRGGPALAIGMASIKQRRVEELEIECHPGLKVGDCVPFYFCPRSVMLFVIHCANHPQLTYRGGQDPILHLEADLLAVVRWAEANGRRWAFSLSNAGARYTDFRSRLEELPLLDWEAIAATDFRPSRVREHKQAEFLLEGSFPFELVESIGIRSDNLRTRAETALAGARSREIIVVRQEWYF
ncbi:MAG: DUF4433 domain-containing protein [Planctomycetes bacterium]|nr:DUF4433 domain-containing protein [Planctomycetota bacterium]